MDYRRLGVSGLKVPALCFGCGAFGASVSGDPLFATNGGDAQAARSLVDLCMDLGINMFDTADFYSAGRSEEVLGQALKGRRDRALISTKTCMTVGDLPDDTGTSRSHLIRACENALRRLDTDYIDLLQLHYYDAGTPITEVVSTLDDLVRAGKVRYVGVSNFAGWQLMKSLAVADRYGYARYVSNEAFYSIANRDYEHELMPLALSEGIGGLAYSPLAWGRLSGRFGRGQVPPSDSRAATADRFGPPIDHEHLYRVLDVLEEVSNETEKSIPQVAINWLLRRPTVSSVIIGARNEDQLRANVAALHVELSSEQMTELDARTQRPAPYPHFLRSVGPFAGIDPSPVPLYRVPAD